MAGDGIGETLVGTPALQGFSYQPTALWQRERGAAAVSESNPHKYANGIGGHLGEALNPLLYVLTLLYHVNGGRSQRVFITRPYRWNISEQLVG